MQVGVCVFALENLPFMLGNMDGSEKVSSKGCRTMEQEKSEGSYVMRWSFGIWMKMCQWARVRGL